MLTFPLKEVSEHCKKNLFLQKFSVAHNWKALKVSQELVDVSLVAQFLDLKAFRKAIELLGIYLKQNLEQAR